MNAPPIKAEPPTTSTRYEGTHQRRRNINTGTPCSASRPDLPPLDEIDSTRPRVEQLLFFDIAGAAAEPYTPARARRRAKAALGGEGRADR